MDMFEHNTEEEIASDDETDSQVKRNVLVGEKFLIRALHLVLWIIIQKNDRFKIFFEPL